MHRLIVPEAFEGTVSKVYHSDVHAGGRQVGLAVRGGARVEEERRLLWGWEELHRRLGTQRALWVVVGEQQALASVLVVGQSVTFGPAALGLGLLALVDDEERAGVEAVGGLPLQHRLQAAQLAEDGLKQVPPQLRAVVHELVESVPEALDGQAAAVVLVSAQVMSCVHLVHLHRGRKGIAQTHLKMKAMANT